MAKLLNMILTIAGAAAFMFAAILFMQFIFNEDMAKMSIAEKYKADLLACMQDMPLLTEHDQDRVIEEFRKRWKDYVSSYEIMRGINALLDARDNAFNNN